MSIPESFQFSPFPIFNNNSACDTHVEFLDLSLVDLFNSAIFVCQFPIAIPVDLDALDDNFASPLVESKVLFCAEMFPKKTPWKSEEYITIYNSVPSFLSSDGHDFNATVLHYIRFFIFRLYGL